jgi:hypothetical protein
MAFKSQAIMSSGTDGTELKRNSAFGKKRNHTIRGWIRNQILPQQLLCVSRATVASMYRIRDGLLYRLVRIGDKVLVSGNNKYEEIYSFGHRNTAASVQFVQISSNDTDAPPIEISSDHLILRDNTHWVPAGNVRIGDVLTKGDGSPVAVTQVRYVMRKGIVAPFTKSGSIVVNNIVASNYITLQGSEYLIVVGGIETPLSFHWLAHTFQSGHRLACDVMTTWCDKESYTDAGISHWVYMPHMVGTMLLQQTKPTMVVTSCVVIPLILVVFGTLYVVEQCCTTVGGAGVVVVVGGGVLMCVTLLFGHTMSSFRSKEGKSTRKSLAITHERMQ